MFKIGFLSNNPPVCDPILKTNKALEHIEKHDLGITRTLTDSVCLFTEKVPVHRTPDFDGTNRGRSLNRTLDDCRLASFLIHY